MQAAVHNIPRVAATVIAATLLLLLGFVAVVGLGADTLADWSSIGTTLAACGIVWAIAGAAAIAAGFWALISLGRSALPLWIGATSIIVAGAVLIVSVQAHVKPCASPS
jgi:hypothetical protein